MKTNELVSTRRDQFLAANPKAREMQKAFERDFQKRFKELLAGLKPLLHGFVSKAEQARQIGIVIIEFADTLPGKRLTLDFYEQMKHLFVDPQGGQISLEQLDWFQRVARKNEMPITDYRTAEKWSQPVLMAGGFALESESRKPATRIRPSDEYTLLTQWLENPELAGLWHRLRQNENYFPNGQLRDDLREVWREQWAPNVKVLREIMEVVGL